MILSSPRLMASQHRVQPYVNRFVVTSDAFCEEDDGSDLGKRIWTPPPSAAALLPDHVRKEILELGFPDDGYSYLIHLREIKNTGGGSAYYHNEKAKLDQLPLDVKAYDASRVKIPKVNDDPHETSMYSVASRTVGVRIQKAADPEVAALLNDSDLSQFGYDVEDLEEDFVVKANLRDEVEDVEFDTKLNLFEISGPNKEVSQSNVSLNAIDLDGADKVKNHQPVAWEYCPDEKLRVRRLLDEQFDMLELQEYGTNSDDGYDDFIAEDGPLESLAEKLKHTVKNHVKEDLELDDKYKVPADLLHDKERTENADSIESAADVICRCIEYARKYENDDQDEEIVVVQESSNGPEVWDCETIVSTYSNLDNHAGKIEASEVRRKKLSGKVFGALSFPNHVITLKGKEKLPVNYLPHSRNSAMEKVKDVTQQKSKQHGQESKEEKKEWKAAVKEERREARRAKKEMKGLYRCEAQRAQKVAAVTGPSSIHLM
ncbi:hypothetical protein U1Q18_039821 [Sarracenia purpurea var. burkii]